MRDWAGMINFHTVAVLSHKFGAAGRVNVPLPPTSGRKRSSLEVFKG